MFARVRPERITHALLPTIGGCAKGCSRVAVGECPTSVEQRWGPRVAC